MEILYNKIITVLLLISLSESLIIKGNTNMKKDTVLKLIEMLLASDSEVTVKDESTNKKGRYIVLGNRGNTVVGDLTIVGSTGYLTNASVIRRWGTTKGLGELASDGATNDTILDPCGEFEFEMLTTCGMIPVKSSL